MITALLVLGIPTYSWCEENVKKCELALELVERACVRKVSETNVQRLSAAVEKAQRIHENCKKKALECEAICQVGQRALNQQLTLNPRPEGAMLVSSIEALGLRCSNLSGESSLTYLQVQEASEKNIAAESEKRESVLGLNED